MNQAPTIQNAAAPVAPSKQSLLKATGVALVVAIIVLTTAVLPAEYGIDPLGVTATSAATPLTATSGLEALLPWADLGLSGPSTVKLCAAILKSDGFVGNQFLPPLTASSPSIGYPPASLKPIAGLQYVTIAATTAVPPSVAPLGLTLHATPNPFREDARVMLSLPSPASLEVEVLDVTGRHVRTLAQGTSAVGPRTLHWDGRDETGRTLPRGSTSCARARPSSRA